jgi:hypothetical protein
VFFITVKNGGAKIIFYTKETENIFFSLSEPGTDRNGKPAQSSDFIKSIANIWLPYGNLISPITLFFSISTATIAHTCFFDLIPGA